MENSTSQIIGLLLTVVLSVLLDAVIDYLRIQKRTSFNHALDLAVFGVPTILIMGWVAQWDLLLMLAGGQLYLSTRAKWFHVILNRLRDLPEQYRNAKSNLWDDIVMKMGIRWDKLNMILTYTWIVSIFVFFVLGSTWANLIGLTDQYAKLVAWVFLLAFGISAFYLTGINDKVEQKLNDKGIR